MRLRDLFRSTERKSTVPILAGLDPSSFIQAATDKDTENLQKYLQAGYSPDQIDPHSKNSALHAAVESNNIRSIQLLLHAGGQVNIVDGNQSTPLHLATTMAFEDAVQILLIHDADMFLYDNTGRNAFHLAVATGNNRLVQMFLSMTDEDLKIINSQDLQKWTPLMCACASNHPSTCALLLSLGANITMCNDQGQNIFHLAAFLGSLSIIQEILNSSIDEELLIKALNQGDFRNQTCLFYACAEGHVEMALIFLNAGADPYHLDKEKQTFLHATLSSSIILKRHLNLLYQIIPYVDFRSIEDQHGRTLLDLAHLNRLKTISSLLNHFNYSSQYEIMTPSSPTKSFESLIATKQILTLRQQSILVFKRSINFRDRSKFSSLHDILESAIDQTFQLQPKLIDRTSSTDQINSNDKKQTKNSRISSLIYFTNKFKRERLNSLPDGTEKINSNHPMKHLASQLLNNANRLDEILDFPSLNNHPALDDDLKSVMATYNLNRTIVSDPI